MNQEVDNQAVSDAVEAALDPESFDVLAFLEDQPVAEDTFDIYTHLPSARRLNELVTARQAELAKRREAARRGEGPALGLDEDAEDTEYDDEINALVETLEQTKLTFKIRSVAPALRKAIEKKYRATAKAKSKEGEGWSAEDFENHNRKATADVLSRAIASVTTADGRTDERDWTPDELLSLEEKLYEAQAGLLIDKLYQMVYVGDVFEEALNADFS